MCGCICADSSGCLEGGLGHYKCQSGGLSLGKLVMPLHGGVFRIHMRVNRCV